MTKQIAHAVLRRMASPPPPAPDDVPITSSKAIRLAITRAADKTHKMALSVSALREEVVSLEDMLAAIEPEMMLLGMQMDGRAQGIAAVGLELRAAVLELQTVGRVLEGAAEDRAPTETDARLSVPLITAFLAHLQTTASQTALDGWGEGFTVGDRFQSPRAAGLILDDVKFRVIRISVDLGHGGRTSDLSIALPSRAKCSEKVVKADDTGNWETRFQSVVNASPAKLDALLHRFKLPLYRAQGLAVGQVIPLPGCTVSSIQLLAGDGRRVATARLGQSGGMRAVRIEAAPHLQMRDMDQLGAAGAMEQLISNNDDVSSVSDIPIDLDDAPGMSMDVMEAEIAADADEEEVPINAEHGATAVPLSWDDEDIDAAPAQALSWDDENLSGADEPGDASSLDWSNEDFDPPQS